MDVYLPIFKENKRRKYDSIFKTLHIFGFECFQFPLCVVQDLGCLAKIKIKPRDCLKSCEGIYADVIKSDIDFEELDGIKQMVKKYETYKHMNESYVRFPNELKG